MLVIHDVVSTQEEYEEMLVVHQHSPIVPTNSFLVCAKTLSKASPINIQYVRHGSPSKSSGTRSFYRSFTPTQEQ